MEYIKNDETVRVQPLAAGEESAPVVNAWTRRFSRKAAYASCDCNDQNNCVCGEWNPFI